ncbi:MAG: FixH family protein [Gammaproteobacteria bacterium]|nr:FixH family protein [Gammaproteobacteria bacterium]MDH5799880.1 FixH family protein [Gammaproteobacteria bacterium]
MLVLACAPQLQFGTDSVHTEGHDNENHNHNGHQQTRGQQTHDSLDAHHDHMDRGQFDPLQYTSRAKAVTLTTEEGNYRLSLFSNEAPIPVNKLHSWTVHVEDLQGNPLETGKLYANGGMPQHNHGYPTRLSVKKYLGSGDYEVEGVRFDMYGHWEMSLSVQVGLQTEFVLFKVNLQPPLPEQTKNTHWSDAELAVLQSFWIGNLAQSPNPGNRVADDVNAVALGHKLFFDTRFSANGQVACANCHQPQRYFTDGLKVARGLGEVERNAPTIVGASHNIWFFHDGRADSMWSQALGPLEDRQEHGGSRTQYAHLVYNDPAYKAQYEQLFGPMPDLSDRNRFPLRAGPVKDPVLLGAWLQMSEADQQAVTRVFVNLAKAVEAYERRLQPGISLFDRYVEAALKNDTETMQRLLSKDEVAGLRLFISKANCSICHNGPLFTDHGFHNIAVPPMSSKRYDWGRYKATAKVRSSEFNCRGPYSDQKDKHCPELEYIIYHKEETAASFKTPGLRNVSKTAPYMHAGQYTELADVMRHYAKPPSTKVGMSDLLPVELSEKEQGQLQAFLRTLDSEINAPAELLRAP